MSMAKRLYVHIFILLAFLASAVFISAPVFAVDPLSGVDCATAQDSAVCSRTGQDPVTGSTGIIRNATRLVALIAGAAAIIVIVLAGIRYITSNGEAEQVSRAKKTIIFASVGLIVIVLGQVIISFVLSKV